MNETTQYHLNQWEAEDRILRQDFNRDNANLEQALLTLKTAVEAEVRARTEAVAGERSDAASALETVRAALDAAKAEKTALAALQAQVDALPFVRLREVTTTAAANQIDVDISNLALAPVSLCFDRSQTFLRNHSCADAAQRCFRFLL